MPTGQYSASLGHNGLVNVPASQPPNPDDGVTARPAPRLSCVGAVIIDESGRMLLILRGHEPGRGLWSIPGGRIEPGETDQQAVVREVAEETGLRVTCGRLLGSAELPHLAGAIVEVRDYLATVLPGSARAATAGDDADAVRWVTDAEAGAMDERGELTAGLLTALRSWL